MTTIGSIEWLAAFTRRHDLNGAQRKADDMIAPDRKFLVTNWTVNGIRTRVATGEELLTEVPSALHAHPEITRLQRGEITIACVGAENAFTFVVVELRQSAIKNTQEIEALHSKIGDLRNALDDVTERLSALKARA